MYQQSARIYDALCRNKDYAGACERLRGLLRQMAPQARTLLDVATGTGRHLVHLCEHYAAEGLDLSAPMLEIARERCPTVPLHEGDLTSFRLGRRFDVVTCLFGSIGYATTLADLARAASTLAAHLEPGGVLVVEPWITPDRYHEGRLKFDTVDDPHLKVARMYLMQRRGRVSVLNSEYVVGTSSGVVHFSERQELGLFTDAEYRGALAQAGIELVDPGIDLFGYGLYAGRLVGAAPGNG